MARKLVQVHCSAVQDGDWDDFHFQLLLDGQDRVVPGVLMSGIYGKGDRRGTGNWPFMYIVTSQDRDEIDFGTYPEIFKDGEFTLFHPTRFGRSSMPGKAVRPGELVTMWVHGDEVCHRIQSVEVLMAGSAVPQTG